MGYQVGPLAGDVAVAEFVGEDTDIVVEGASESQRLDLNRKDLPHGGRSEQGSAEVDLGRPLAEFLRGLLHSLD